jgi:hypothetical protein
MSMFLAPLRWAYPDLSLPAINDCWYHSSLTGEVGHGIPPAAAFYEIAAGWYGDPAFGTVLAANYSSGRARDSVEALLFGPDEVPLPARPNTSDASGASRASVPSHAGVMPAAVPPLPPILAASADLPDFGIAVMRGLAPGDDPARRTFLLLKYGPHGGGHGHPDKLGIVLFAQGERLSPDLGTPGYGIALNDSWYRHTLSHNTVLLDGQRQPPATGRLLAFTPLDQDHRDGSGGGAGYGVIDAAVEWPAAGGTDGAADAAAIYAGVRMRRLILFRPSYFVDVFTVASPQPRRIEWAYHNRGELAGFGTPGAAFGRSAAPQPSDLPAPLTLRAVLPGQDDVLASFTTGAASLQLWMAGTSTDSIGDDDTRTAAAVPSSWVFAAGAPGNPASETMALILRRCTAPNAVFASVFHPHDTRGGQPDVRAVTWGRREDAWSCKVTTSRGVDCWEIPLQEGAPARFVERGTAG